MPGSAARVGPGTAGGNPVSRVELAVVFPRGSVTGGVERVALDLARYESTRRATCFVGEQIDDELVDLAPVTTPNLPKALRPLGFRRAAARTLSSISPATSISFGADCPPGDVYWVQSVHAAWLAHGGEVFFRGVRVPAQVRRALLRHQVLLRLERDYFTRHRPRRILCTSPREAEDLARIYDVPRDLMQIVPNGYDGKLFSVARRDSLRDAMRERLGIRPDQRSVLLVANEWHRKGLGVLLRALGSLRDPSLRLDLVGRTAPGDYERLADQVGLAGRMYWHGPSTDVAEYYAATDVFALPTTYEPFGIVIVEAMASGVPVVTSRLAGASPAITHGHSGFLLDDPSSVDELATNLSRALEDPTVGARGAVAAQAYEWGQIFRTVDEVLFPTVA